MRQKALPYLLSLACLVCMGSSLSGQTVLLNYFTLNPDGANVMLEWEIQSETGVKEFRLFRRFNNDPGFAHVVTVPVNGSQKYQHLDDDIFKTLGRVIHYELQIVTDNKVHKFAASLSHNPTSIQRTWGSIKAMFR